MMISWNLFREDFPGDTVGRIHGPVQVQPLVQEDSTHSGGMKPTCTTAKPTL